MRKFFLLSVMVPVCIFAQVSEDFSDGDFTQNPSWTGDLSHFKLSSTSAVPVEQRPALQLDAPAAGNSVLSTPQHLSGDLEWQFWVKHSFNSSSGNYSRIYLLAGQHDLLAPLDGYFLRIGGDDDSVRFFRQDSLQETMLLCLATVFAGNSTNSMRFRVMRSAEGKWQFYADPGGNHSLDLQGETEDLSFPGGEYFGFRCQYTSSNTTKFYVDDIYAGPLIVDSIPPELAEVHVVSPAEIRLVFTEPLDKSLAEDTANYMVSPSIGHPYEAMQLLDPSQVYLFFGHELENGSTYELQITNMKDPAGNGSGQINREIRYYSISPYDLVFTEIMADPTPPFGLPEYEYLEILNRSPFSLNIEGLRLKISATEHDLPSYTIEPGAYLLFCDDDAEEIMQHVAPVLGLSSFSLPNSGAPVHLTDTAGMTIAFLEYDLAWYKNNQKADGGWALEMIDTENPCKNEENWAASVNSSGGTPGDANSHLPGEPELLQILKTCTLGNTEIEIEFSESLDSLIASDTTRYLAGPWLGNPSIATPVGPAYRSVVLQFREAMQTDQSYQLTVQPGLVNCTGTASDAELSTAFAAVQPAGPFDIIINEVLFNPLGDGVDFVEIYNRGRKAIELNELLLASVKNSETALPDTQSVSISATCNTLLPLQYLVLSPDQDIVKSQFFTKDAGAFLDMPSFPSFNNDEGCVLLLKNDKTVIDGMEYSEEMHFLMLNSTDGVSLERISHDRLGYDPENWHSAAETAGFGTPGYQNSQYLEILETSSSVSIQPEVFSPDGDGRDDQLGIVYNFDSPGKLLSVLIFDAAGRLARTLVNNEMPGTKGIYTWDGTMDDRTEAQPGIYIVYLEALGMDGKTNHYKKAAVLTRNR
jgi:hypothetical protein